jgi:hypothetical protein
MVMMILICDFDMGAVVGLLCRSVKFILIELVTGVELPGQLIAE